MVHPQEELSTCSWSTAAGRRPTHAAGSAGPICVLTFRRPIPSSTATTAGPRFFWPGWFPDLGNGHRRRRGLERSRSCSPRATASSPCRSSSRSSTDRRRGSEAVEDRLDRQRPAPVHRRARGPEPAGHLHRGHALGGGEEHVRDIGRAARDQAGIDRPLHESDEPLPHRSSGRRPTLPGAKSGNGRENMTWATPGSGGRSAGSPGGDRRGRPADPRPARRPRGPRPAAGSLRRRPAGPGRPCRRTARRQRASTWTTARRRRVVNPSTPSSSMRAIAAWSTWSRRVGGALLRTGTAPASGRRSVKSVSIAARSARASRRGPGAWWRRGRSGRARRRWPRPLGLRLEQLGRLDDRAQHPGSHRAVGREGLGEERDGVRCEGGDTLAEDLERRAAASSRSPPRSWSA